MASAAPQLVPYVHEEIAAEPYVHLEPALSAEALGETPEAQGVLRAAAPVAFAGPAFVPAPQQAFAPAPVQAAVYAAAPLCVNNLGAAVPCAL